MSRVYREQRRANFLEKNSLITACLTAAFLNVSLSAMNAFFPLRRCIEASTTLHLYAKNSTALNISAICEELGTVCTTVLIYVSLSSSLVEDVEAIQGSTLSGSKSSKAS